MNLIGFSLNGLTEEQQRVVTHMDGPAVVIACPGSGKTRALTHRVGYLVQRRVPPSAIMGITFTRAAAEEMRTRLAELIPPFKARGVRLFTFHGLAWRILSDIEGRPNLLDERDQKAMAGQLLREVRLNADQTNVDRLLTDFSFFVGAQASMFRPATCDPGLFREIWSRYCELRDCVSAYAVWRRGDPAGSGRDRGGSLPGYWGDQDAQCRCMCTCRIASDG